MHDSSEDIEILMQLRPLALALEASQKDNQC
jgi:hypothetical protein